MRSFRPKTVTPENAKEIAIAALGFIAADEERLQLFMDLTGLDLSMLREAAESNGFFANILDYVAADERLLLALCEELKMAPEHVMQAKFTLSPSEFG